MGWRWAPQGQKQAEERKTHALTCDVFSWAVSASSGLSAQGMGAGERGQAAMNAQCWGQAGGLVLLQGQALSLSVSV